MLTQDKHEIKLEERTIFLVRYILNYFSFNKQAIVTYIHTCDVTTNARASMRWCPMTESMKPGGENCDIQSLCLENGTQILAQVFWN